MTTEEKAKAYDKALESAREALNDGTISSNTIAYLQDIFPELKESEDERIRKWLIGYFQQYRIDGMEVVYTSGFKADDIIAWLEKQGDTNETINRDEFAQGVLKGAAINLITWIDYNVAEGNMCLSNTECKDIIDALANYNWDKIYDYMKKKLEKQVPNPKWSEEDDGMVACIKIHLKQCLNNYAYTSYRKWLESLKQRIGK